MTLESMLSTDATTTNKETSSRRSGTTRRRGATEWKLTAARSAAKAAIVAAATPSSTVLAGRRLVAVNIFILSLTLPWMSAVDATKSPSTSNANISQSFDPSFFRHPSSSTPPTPVPSSSASDDAEAASTSAEISNVSMTKDRRYLIGFLPALTANKGQSKHFVGAFKYALRYINGLLRASKAGYQLDYMLVDNKADTAESLRGMTLQYFNDCIAFIGPEDTCAIEARLAAAWNLPMIAFVSVLVLL